MTAKEIERLRAKLAAAKPLYIGSTEFVIDLGDLDPPYRERAVRELRETPENVNRGLRALREMVAVEPGLKVPMEDDHLTKFLRPCKWYPESAFELLKRFYKYQATHQRYCGNLSPKNERHTLLSGTIAPLPRRTADGARVVLIEGGRKWKPKEVSLDQIFRAVIFYLEAAMVEPKTQVAGIRVMIDMEGLNMSQVTYFTPSFAGAVVEFVQRCLPVRLKGIHIINQPFIFNMVFAFFKPFMQEKLRKRIIFHGTDRNSLRPYFDAKSLPKKYGGELDFPDEPLGEGLIEYFNNFEEEFIAANGYGYPPKT